METIFKTKDAQEAKRIIKSEDMASFIWELVHNGWREFKGTDYEYEIAWKKINELLAENNIDIDELYG
jgi:hypothetical protein